MNYWEEIFLFVRDVITIAAIIYFVWACILIIIEPRDNR